MQLWLNSMRIKIFTMKPGVLLLFWVFFSVSVCGQQYQPVDDGSAVKFSIKNFGVNVNGDFKGLQGTIRFNPSELSTAFFNVTIDANTINTGINARDNHLRKEDYFNVLKYPVISFIAKKVVPTDKRESYIVTADIIIKGISRAVSFPFNAVLQNDGWLFTGEFKLNRKDFKVGKSSFILSDNLAVSLSVVAKRK